MDMMKIEFESLVLSAKAIGANITRLDSDNSYVIVTKKSIELLLEEMEEFQQKYIEVEDD